MLCHHHDPNESIVTPPGDEFCPIAQLDRMQAAHNNGRGICCVQAILLYLRHNERESAIAAFYVEYDKIRNYPDVDNALRQILGLESREEARKRFDRVLQGQEKSQPHKPTTYPGERD